jgi:hypothetical protein
VPILELSDVGRLLPQPLRGFIQPVARIPVPLGPWPLVETDTCQIWPVIQSDAAAAAGEREQVLKVLRDNLDRTTIEGVVCRREGLILGVEDKERSGEDVVASRGGSAAAGLAVRDVHGYVAPGVVASTEFFHEALMGQALHVALHSLTPHVLATTAAYLIERDDKGAILMDRVTCTLHDALKDKHGFRLSGGDVAGVYLQMLHTLSIAQRAAGFKHHDLHDKNVFMAPVPARLADATHFAYTVGSPDGGQDPKTYYVPNRGYMPVMADFGLSSCTFRASPPGGGGEGAGAAGGGGVIALKRVDLGLIGKEDSEDEDEAWGEWSPQLAHRRGYDAQVMFSENPAPRNSRLAWDASLDAFITRAQLLASGGAGRMTSLGRPAVVSDLPPEHLLVALFDAAAPPGGAPDNCYSFSTPPPSDGSRVRHVAHTQLQPYCAPAPPQHAAGGGGGGNKRKKNKRDGGGGGGGGGLRSPKNRRK